MCSWRWSHCSPATSSVFSAGSTLVARAWLAAATNKSAFAVSLNPDTFCTRPPLSIWLRLQPRQNRQPDRLASVLRLHHQL